MFVVYIRGSAGGYSSFNANKFIVQGLQAHSEVIEPLQSLVPFETQAGSDSFFCAPSNDLKEIGVWDITHASTPEKRRQRVKGTLTIGGVVVWDSSVAIADTETLAESVSVVVAPSNADNLPAAVLTSASGVAVGTARTDENTERVQQIMTRWGTTPPAQQFLTLTPQEVKSIKKMEVAAPLQKGVAVYVTILGRTATPVCRQNACAIVLKIQLGEKIEFVWATDATVEQMQKARTPGVGKLLYEQQELIVPGAVFHLKAYALEKNAPWGIVYPADQWYNHVEYKKLPELKKGKALEDGSFGLVIHDFGMATFYPPSGKKGDPPKLYPVVKAPDGSIFRFSQPDTAKKLNFIVGHRVDLIALKVAPPAQSSAAGPSTEAVVTSHAETDSE